jgi:hypothetical protein
VLARAPWLDDGTRDDGFRYRESALAVTDRLWMSGGYPFAAVVARAAARYGWPADIRGTDTDRVGGGLVTGLPAEPGKDFTVVTISIDPHETPADARKARRIGLESIQRPFPPESWRFLTGSAASIGAVADSVGFRFARTGDYYDHPVGIIILSPTGKIVRYMNGADFLPADLKLSLLEASQGKVGPTIARFLRICFSYDPGSRKLVFNTLKVVASVTLAVAGAFVIYLLVAARKKRRRVDPPPRRRAHGS